MVSRQRMGKLQWGYFIAFTVVGWVTYITGYIVSMIKGKAAKEYKWVLGICYLLFYAVIAWTALDKISYYIYSSIIINSYIVQRS